MPKDPCGLQYRLQHALDIKPSNILLHCPSDEEIDRHIAAMAYACQPPSPTHQEGAEENDLNSNSDDADDVTRSPRSLPIPGPHKWNCTPHEAETITVTLVDLGKGKEPPQP